MNWLHACWGVGAATTPAVAAAILAGGHSWRSAYASLAVVELALVFAFVGTRRLWADDAPAETAARPAAPPARARGAAASVLMFFVYGGVEAGAGLWATSLLTLTRGASPAIAGALVAVYWGALTVGRFVLGAAADAVGPTRLLRLAIRGAVCALVALSIPGTPLWFAGAALAALGFALAPVYPLTMHDTARRFGEAGARLVGYQVAACSVGIATIPWVVGVLGARATPLWMPPALAALAVVATGLEVARRRG